MFDDVGTKLKNVAQFSTVVCVILCVVVGVVQISEEALISGIVIIVGGGLVSYLASLMLYAIGEIVDNLKIIADGCVASNDEVSKKNNLKNISNAFATDGIMEIKKRGGK